VPPVLPVHPVVVPVEITIKIIGKGKKGVWCWKCFIFGHTTTILSYAGYTIDPGFFDFGHAC
jgi:hypothetical protein